MRIQKKHATPDTDIEIRAEAELLQAHISLFLDSSSEALRRATHILESATHYELNWIVARAKLLITSLADVNVAQKKSQSPQ